jgi:hypothetical protein
VSLGALLLSSHFVCIFDGCQNSWFHCTKNFISCPSTFLSFQMITIFKLTLRIPRNSSALPSLFSYISHTLRAYVLTSTLLVSSAMRADRTIGSHFFSRTQDFSHSLLPVNCCSSPTQPHSKSRVPQHHVTLLPRTLLFTFTMHMSPLVHF